MMLILCGLKVKKKLTGVQSGYVFILNIIRIIILNIIEINTVKIFDKN